MHKWLQACFDFIHVLFMEKQKIHNIQNAESEYQVTFVKHLDFCRRAEIIRILLSLH